MKRKKMMTQKEINEMMESFQRKEDERNMKENLEKQGKAYHKDEFDAFRGRKA
jgi:hypothetical protein